MNYCIFAVHYLPHLGGIERYVYNMSAKLVEQGDKVVIVASRTGSLPKYEKINGIPVYRVDCFELLDGRYPILKYNKKTRRIFGILKQWQFDLIIINARFYIHSIVAAIFGRINHIPCIILEHGSGHLTIHNPVWDYIGHVFEHVHTYFLKHICNNFYGTCEACNIWLNHFHIKSKGTIYNAINVDELKSSLQIKGNYRQRYGISLDDKVIVFTGRLIKEKGILTLIEAVEKLHDSGKNVYLFIAGNGDLDKEVQQKNSKYIIPLGYISHEEVLRLLDEGDIYCLPSDSEAFCGGVLEAVACKCYVITTAQGGSKELISSDDFGKIIKKNDLDTVYQAIDYCIDNWEISKAAANRAYDKLMNNYTWDIVIKKVRNLNITN